MPEAAIEEHGDLQRWEDDIWPNMDVTGRDQPVLAEPKPVAMQGRP